MFFLPVPLAMIVKRALKASFEQFFEVYGLQLLAAGYLGH